MTQAHKDPPIIKQEYLSGPKVVDIGDLRVARGMSRREYSTCTHLRMIYDTSERRIWCEECESNIEAFDAFKKIVENFSAGKEQLEKRQHEINNAEQCHIVSLATKNLDKVWRMRDMVPACPSCGNGLFPEDFKHGVKSMLGREFAKKKRT